MLGKPLPYQIPLDLVSPTKLMFETTIHGAKMELTGRVLTQYAQVPGLIQCTQNCFICYLMKSLMGELL